MQMTERGRAMWRMCLASAFRTALACTIVGAATLYGPQWILRYVAFPGFSYVTVILIITDATLGDTLRGCWLALYATCQSVAPAIITLRLIGPARLTAGTTALAAALAAFVVVLPNGSTHLVAKRIALGQIVLIYVIGYINGAETEPVMHPLRVAASTALGVIACVFALLIPLPRLATCEAQDFRTQGTQMRRKMWFQNMKIKLIVLAIIIALILIIVLSVCGGFNCGK